MELSRNHPHGVGDDLSAVGIGDDTAVLGLQIKLILCHDDVQPIGLLTAGVGAVEILPGLRVVAPLPLVGIRTGAAGHLHFESALIAGVAVIVETATDNRNRTAADRLY